MWWECESASPRVLRFGLSADFPRCVCAALQLDSPAALHLRLVGASGGDVFEKLYFPRVAVSLYSCAVCFVVAKSPVELPTLVPYC